MKQVLDQLLKFLQQGIAAIFHFIELVWTWSVDQVSKLMAVPWQDWPLWKQVLLVLILAGVVWALFGAGRQLLRAGVAVLAAFAGPAWRARQNAAACISGGGNRARRRVACQSPRQFRPTDARLDAGQDHARQQSLGITALQQFPGITPLTAIKESRRSPRSE